MMIRKEVLAYLKVTEDRYKRYARKCLQEYKRTGDKQNELAAFIYRDVAHDMRIIHNSVRLM